MPHADGGCDVTAGGAAERFDVVVGADGAWSRVRPLLTDTMPLYEDVTLVEFGFDAKRHATVDALVGSGKMFAVGDNRMLIAQRNGHGHIRGYAGLRLAEIDAREWTAAAPERIRASLLRDLRRLGAGADRPDRTRRFHRGTGPFTRCRSDTLGRADRHHACWATPRT